MTAIRIPQGLAAIAEAELRSLVRQHEQGLLPAFGYDPQEPEMEVVFLAVTPTFAEGLGDERPEAHGVAEDVDDAA